MRVDNGYCHLRGRAWRCLTHSTCNNNKISKSLTLTWSNRLYLCAFSLRCIFAPLQYWFNSCSTGWLPFKNCFIWERAMDQMKFLKTFKYWKLIQLSTLRVPCYLRLRLGTCLINDDLLWNSLILLKNDFIR